MDWSHMNGKTKELLDKLSRASWFSAVGHPPAGDVVAISSWKEARNCCASDEWQNFTLEQSNVLTMYLAKHARDRFDGNWSDLLAEVKASVEPLIDDRMRHCPYPPPPECGHDITSCVRWDVVQACMELEYSDIRPPAFSCELMKWYLSGHFPCGWGERDAEGQLRLYGPVDESGYDPNEPDVVKLVLSDQE